MRKSLLTAAGAACALVLAACGGGGGTGATTATAADPGTGSGTEVADPPANVNTKTLKFAFTQTMEHPQAVAAVQMGEDLYRLTDGRYKIEVFPTDLLGSQAEVMENMAQGTVEFSTVFGPLLSQLNPDFGVFDLPYMFDSIAAQDAVFGDTELLKPLYASLEDSKNITVLAAMHIGERNIYNRIRPIVEPSDLEGLKIRVPQSDMQLEMIGLMGAIGTPMGFGDIYTALQSGVLDGAENGMVGFHDVKHDEVAKYLSYTKHLMAPDYLIMSTSMLESMSPEDQEIMWQLAEEYRVHASEGFKEAVITATEKAVALGVQFNEANIPAFKELLLPMHEKYITTDFGKTLWDAVKEANASNS